MADPRVSSRRGRLPAEEVEERRKEYLEVALQTFLKNGYERTTLEEIARAARAGKITLYRQFGNKEQLFRLVVKEAITRTRASLKIEEDKTSPPEEVLCQVVARLYEGFTNPYLLAVRRLVVAEYSRFPELAHQLRSHNRELLSSVEAYLERANERGDLAIPDAHAAALQLSTLASGGMRFLISEPIMEPARKAHWIDAIARFAWNSWRPEDQV